MRIKKGLTLLIALLVVMTGVAFATASQSQVFAVDYNDTYTTSSDTLSDEEAATLVALLSGALLIPMMILGVGLWIYSSYSYMTIGNKVGEPNSWMAWVPGLNFYYMVKLAGLNGWFALIIFAAIVPIIGALVVVAFGVYLAMQIAKRRGFDEWLGLLTLVPLANLVLPGYLAFAEPSQKTPPTASDSSNSVNNNSSTTPPAPTADDSAMMDSNEEEAEE